MNTNICEDNYIGKIKYGGVDWIAVLPNQIYFRKNVVGHWDWDYDQDKFIIYFVDNFNPNKRKKFKEHLRLDLKEKKIITEDLGITFEHAFCTAKNINFVGNFKYSTEKSNIISTKIYELIQLVPKLEDTKYIHTAKNGARYDFTEDNSDNPKYLSLKTNKSKGGKVAPQVIGQPSVDKFCDNFNIKYTNNDDLKKFISENISDILKVMVDFTFDCPNLYYNEEEDVIKYIKLKNEIVWDKSKISHTGIIENGIWYKNEKGQKVVSKSKTFKYNNKSIIEIQFHDKNRKNMAIRWYYDNLLDCFKDNFDITTLN